MTAKSRRRFQRSSIPAALSKASFDRLSADLFPIFAERYLDNTYRVSGVARGKYAKPPKLDEPHHLDDPSPFLDGTPFAGILATPLPVEIPAASRTSHHWIVAGTGAGKTTALQYFIAKDLERAVRGECSIVILDSQRQLVEELWSLKLFAPGQPLDGKLCILDAADIEYPIAVNLFDMHLDRLAFPLAARPRAADQQRARDVRLHHRIAVASGNDEPSIDALSFRHPRDVRDPECDDPHLP